MVKTESKLVCCKLVDLAFTKILEAKHKFCSMLLVSKIKIEVNIMNNHASHDCAKPIFLLQ